MPDWDKAGKRVAAKGLMHWHVPEDRAIEYVERFGWQHALGLDLEASEGFTDGKLHSPGAWLRKMVKDELGDR